MSESGLWEPLDKNTERRTVEIEGYTIRFAWEPEWHGWVDFAVYEKVGWTGDTGAPYYPLPNWTKSGDDTLDIDKAGPLVEGFVKWDGCTQFTVGHVHVDHREDLEGFCLALETARSVAFEIIGDQAMEKEYG